jgi:hypothetical protein
MVGVAAEALVPSATTRTCGAVRTTTVTLRSTMSGSTLPQGSLSIKTGDIYTRRGIDQLEETMRYVVGEDNDAPGRNRTCDLALRRRTLYPLSYRREGV